jgi:hypothetical protein
MKDRQDVEDGSVIRLNFDKVTRNIEIISGLEPVGSGIGGIGSIGDAEIDGPAT